MMPVDKLTLIKPTSSVLCAVTVIGTSKTDRRATKAGRPRLYTTLAEKFTMESTS